MQYHVKEHSSIGCWPYPLMFHQNRMHTNTIPDTNTITRYRYLILILDTDTGYRYWIQIRGAQVHSREVKFPGKEPGSCTMSGFLGLVMDYRELIK